MQNQTFPKTFAATIQKDTEASGWTHVRWAESADFFGTRKPVKVTGTIDGCDFQATFLPLGDGTHLLPLKAATMKAIKKQVGDTIEVCLKSKI
jgi:hypothetical protein